MGWTPPRRPWCARVVVLVTTEQETSVSEANTIGLDLASLPRPSTSSTRPTKPSGNGVTTASPAMIREHPTIANTCSRRRSSAYLPSGSGSIGRIMTARCRASDPRQTAR